MPENNLHPITSIFPRLEGDDFDALVDDIRKHGLREAIWRHRNGEILDGDNRWRACQVLGIKCPSRTFEGDDSEILAFVISQNLRRRHLDASQRAMIAAELANLKDGQRADRVAGSIDLATASRLMNVGEKSIKRAKVVRRDAVPEVVRAVERGQLSVSRAAAIAKVEPARQRQIVNGDEPLAQLVPKPERQPDDLVGHRIRIAYSEPEEPTVIRVPVYETQLEPPPPIPAYSPTPAELYGLRDAFSGFKMTPERAVAVIPADRRGEFADMAQRQHTWLREFLRLLNEAGGEAMSNQAGYRSRQNPDHRAARVWERSRASPPGQRAASPGVADGMPVWDPSNREPILGDGTGDRIHARQRDARDCDRCHAHRRFGRFRPARLTKRAGEPLQPTDRYNPPSATASGSGCSASNRRRGGGAGSGFDWRLESTRLHACRRDCAAT